MDKIRRLLVIAGSLVFMTWLFGFVYDQLEMKPTALVQTPPERQDKDIHRSFGQESPAGFSRNDYSMQGAASAVQWLGDTVYLAAMAVLQVYYAPPGAAPQLIREIELRDWVHDMDVDGATLFLAARGDGLYAFDLSDPQQPAPAGRVSGLFDAGGTLALRPCSTMWTPGTTWSPSPAPTMCPKTGAA